MPHVNSKNQVKRNGQHSKSDMMNTVPKAIPRDNLNTAFAGDENKGPKKDQKAKHNGTHLKSRRIGEKSDRTPIR